MATSQTVGQTRFTTRQVIDHAHRRAKVPVQLISGEDLDFALDNLWLWLMEQASKGVPVWKIQTQLLPLYQGQPIVPTEVGTVEVLNANLRTGQRLTGTYTSSAGGTPANAFDGDLQTAFTQVAPNGNLVVDFDTGITITTIGLLPNATGTWNFTYQISEDGVTWSDVDVFTAQAVVEREWLWFDYQITEFSSYQFFRIVASGGTTLDIVELYIANLPSAIPMAPLNKDDYFDLPNKSFQGRPVQFWQDLKRDKPQLALWPVPDFASNFKLVEAQCHMQIMDVGTLVQELELPPRWFQAACWCLAEYVVNEHPQAKGDPEWIATQARNALALAWGGISAKGPLYLQPNISPYTR